MSSANTVAGIRVNLRVYQNFFEFSCIFYMEFEKNPKSTIDLSSRYFLSVFTINVFDSKKYKEVKILRSL